MEDIDLDVHKGCTRNWPGMQVLALPADVGSRVHYLLYWQETKPGPLSGRCKKEKSNQPDIHLEAKTDWS